jgi:hypothetical protein
MRSPVSRVAAAVILVVAIGGVAVWFHGGGTTFAFADFVKPILEAKNARFKITSEGEVNGRVIKATAQVMVLGVSRQRQDVESEMPGKSKMVMIFDNDKGKILTLEPMTKKAMLLTMTNMPKGKMSMDKDPFGWLRLLLSDARDKPDFKREPLGEKEIDGRRVVGFRVNTNGGVVSLWGDPKTGLPVRAEITMTMFNNAKTTLSDFQFNVEMDESLFSLEPPAGYTLQDMGTIDMSPAEEKDLIETFREYSKLKQAKQPLPIKDIYSPTGADYRYEVTPSGYIVRSCGEDGIFGNADDEMLIDGVGPGKQREQHPLQEEQKRKAETEKAPGERPRATVSTKAKSAKSADAADTPPIDPKTKALGETVAKRLNTFTDVETLILKDGETGRMKIKKNATPVVELLVTPHFVKDGTTFDLESVDATGKAIEGSKVTSGTIHNAQVENSLGTAFFVHGQGILTKVQLHPTRQDDNRVAVEVKVLFTGLPTSAETEAMLLSKGKRGQLESNFMKIGPALSRYQLKKGHYPKTLAELSDGGAFPDSLDLMAMMPVVFEKFAPAITGKPSDEQMRKMSQAQIRLQRGAMFVLNVLPKEADAHYAGKGVKFGAADRPIFWYRPKDARKYRVIYADLSVRDADAAPNVPNAQPVPGAANATK